jgi:hypothetical protein
MWQTRGEPGFAARAAGRLSAITVVAATIMMVPAIMGHAEYTLHRADGAADACADCTPDHPAHRASYPVALISALLRAADDALGMTEMGDEE